MCSALIICGAYISFPLSFSPVPIVLQNFFVLLSGLLLGAWYAALSVLLYLFLGSIGLPVFAGGAGGIAHLLGPTGGYLIGFFFSALFVGVISSLSYRVGAKGARRDTLGKGRHRNRRYSSHHGALYRYVVDSCALIVGVLAVYACGLPWLIYTNRLGFTTALAVGFFPFLIGDTLKAVLALIVARFLESKALVPRRA